MARLPAAVESGASGSGGERRDLLLARAAHPLLPALKPAGLGTGTTIEAATDEVERFDVSSGDTTVLRQEIVSHGRTCTHKRGQEWSVSRIVRIAYPVPEKAAKVSVIVQDML